MTIITTNHTTALDNLIRMLCFVQSN